MFGDVIFPTDGSERSFVALPTAASLAAGLGTTVRIVAGWGDLPKAVMRYRVDDHRWQLGGADHELLLERHDRPIALLLRDIVDNYPGSFVCMSTHGRGRSAAVLGSVATETIDQTECPVVLAGPRCSSMPIDTDRSLVIASDGSPFADTILPIAEHLATAMGMATDMRSHRSESHPAASILEYATQRRAALLAIATHNEYHARRLIKGSVTASVVRRASCPVLTIRPQSVTGEPSDDPTVGIQLEVADQSSMVRPIS